MDNDAWILGIHMTRFGKHPDQDLLDLASTAVMGALMDGGVSMNDIGILAAGNRQGLPGAGQRIQKQIGQTGIPVYNVENTCATGATAMRVVILAIKSGECDFGLAVGVEKLAGAGLLAGGTPEPDMWIPTGRSGAVMPLDGRINVGTPGVFAEIGMEYLHTNRYLGNPLELFARIS